MVSSLNTLVDDSRTEEFDARLRDVESTISSLADVVGTVSERLSIVINHISPAILRPDPISFPLLTRFVGW